MLSTKFLFPFSTCIRWFWPFKIVVERHVEEHGFLPLKRVNSKSVSVWTLLALPFKHLVFYLKDLWFIHEIPMPSTSLLEIRSVAEPIPLWIRFNIQVAPFNIQRDSNPQPLKNFRHGACFEQGVPWNSDKL